ncbi:MAG: nucleotidyltransferase domain-containing protein [Phycisphaerales bacterium]|nr:nucleotidyltransferase domain-containing protein [Phycisphaerales bacterium]
MIDALQQHRSDLAGICRRFDVLRLEAFGSAVADGGRRFDPATSDLDFLVLFRRDGRTPADERYFGLREALQSLYGRKADLVDIAAARNPYFVAQALQQRISLYAA